MLTEQAVFAFEKLNGLPIDGEVDDAEVNTLQGAVPPQPGGRSAEVVWEVDKTHQVLLATANGVAMWVWNTSTGTEKPYVHDGHTALADTPVGHYTIDWQVDGVRDGALGPLYRPKYFHPDGLAIHGYNHVPPTAASHGCVRVTFAAMDFIWQSGLAPLGAAVWVYGSTGAGAAT